MSLSTAARSLQFAVRPRLVIKYLGVLVLPLAGLTIVPMGVALIAGEFGISLRFAVIVVGLATAGWLCVRLPCAAAIQQNEALVTSVALFLTAALAYAIPFQGYGIPPEDAVFEAISAVTSTGLSTLNTVENKPASFLFARAWLQWIGGLGVVVLALALLIDPGSSARRLGFSEREIDDIEGGTRAHARRVLWVYLALTGFGVALLLALGLSPFDAIVHTLAAVSTGGFSSYDASLAGLAWWPARVGVIVLGFAGALSFAWYYSAIFKNWRTWLNDRRFVALTVTCLLSGALMVLFTSVQDKSFERWSDALLLAVSAQTTSGFNTIPVSEFPPATQLTLIGSMLIGGDAGATAGGIKLWRLLILMRVAQFVMLRVSTPEHSRMPLRVAGERLHPRELETAVAVVLVYLLVIGCSWTVFLVYGVAPFAALFEIVSAIGTVGLSVGVTGPDLAPGLKLVLGVDMLMGRLEMLAVIVLLLPSTWVGKRRRSQ